jgi:hypothetical protein
VCDRPLLYLLPLVYASLDEFGWAKFVVRSTGVGGLSRSVCGGGGGDERRSAHELHMRPHTATYVSSYCCTCVLILLHVCSHTATYVGGGDERRSDDVLALRLKVSELERMVRSSMLVSQPGGGGHAGHGGGGGHGVHTGAAGVGVSVSASVSSVGHESGGRAGIVGGAPFDARGRDVAAEALVSRMEERLAMLVMRVWVWVWVWMGVWVLVWLREGCSR